MTATSSGLRASHAFRWVFAAVDATLVCFGLWWWFYGVTGAWLPQPVFFVAATIVWTGEFFTRSPLGERV